MINGLTYCFLKESADKKLTIRSEQSNLFFQPAPTGGLIAKDRECKRRVAHIIPQWLKKNTDIVET